MSGKFDCAAEVAAANEIARLRGINAELVAALEVSRMQLRAGAAGKIALSPEKHLAIIEAAIRKATP